MFGTRIIGSTVVILELDIYFRGADMLTGGVSGWPRKAGVFQKAAGKPTISSEACHSAVATVTILDL